MQIVVIFNLPWHRTLYVHANVSPTGEIVVATNCARVFVKMVPHKFSAITPRTRANVVRAILFTADRISPAVRLCLMVRGPAAVGAHKWGVRRGGGGPAPGT